MSSRICGELYEIGLWEVVGGLGFQGKFQIVC